MRPILVTGVAGFIGSHVARRLVADGQKVVGVDDLSMGHRSNIPREIDFIEGDLSKTATYDALPKEIDHMRRMAPVSLGLTETQLRGMLGMFGLSGSKVFQESRTLSGGEKTKLALAMLMVGRNNLLLLDEPTNNLDPSSREAVADALAKWQGAIVLVSHDTEFVEQLAPTKVLLMPDGQVDYFSAEWLDLVSLA